MNNSDFSNAKVGDKVTSLDYGHGFIKEIAKEENYPILAYFGNGNWETYTEIGKGRKNHFLPTLFKGHIDPNSFSTSYKTL